MLNLFKNHHLITLNKNSKLNIMRMLLKIMIHIDLPVKNKIQLIVKLKVNFILLLNIKFIHLLQILIPHPETENSTIFAFDMDIL